MDDSVDIALPGRLTPRLLEHAAEPVKVRVSPQVWERVDKCHRFVLSSVASGREIYGLTTGFGPLVGYAGRADLRGQCQNTLDHITAGQGDDLDAPVVRAMLLTRLWSLSHGYSGVSPDTMRALIAALGTRFSPAVPELGSVGASGDLIPLAYAVRALTGDGHAYLGNKRMDAAEALDLVGLEPLELGGRDALAVINGTSLTVAAAGLALAQLRRSVTVATLLSALLADVLGSAPVFAHPALLRAFNHAGAERVADGLRTLLAGMTPSPGRPLQEPYTVRCTPQLLGAAWPAVRYAEQVVTDDLNGVSDNPIFLPDDGEVVHGGNFFGQPVAFAADLMSTVTTQLGNLAERQIDLLMDPGRNGGRNPLLAAEPGQQHGLGGVQLAATAIVADMRRRAVPASMQSLPTNLHNQDVVPFGTQAAINARKQTNALRWLHGSLAISLRQAIHLGHRELTASACADVFEQIADIVPPVDPDRPLAAAVREVADLLDRMAEHRLPDLFERNSGE